MTLKERITEDMKSALKAQDAPKLSAIRLLFSAIKQREIDERIALDDTQVIQVVEKLLKQRRESISQFTAAGRNDLADKEQFEADLLQTYMPQPLSAEEVDRLINDAFQATGASNIKDMGKLMTWLRPQLAGRADAALVSAKVKAKLAGG